MDILDIFLDILLKPPQPLMGLFLTLPLATGGLGGGFFLGTAAAAAAGGTTIGFGILAGLPTCAFHGTVACGGVTAGGPAGATIG